MEIKTIIWGVLLSVVILVPLGIKWQIEKRITLIFACLIGIFTGVVVQIVGLYWNLNVIQVLATEFLLILLIPIMTFLYLNFNWDPERIPPQDENAILSPADGKIIYVKKIDKGQIPISEKKGQKFSLYEFIQSDSFPQAGYLIGIAMNYLDVHVNRAPISGKVVMLRHIKGLFLSLKRFEAVVQNERVLTVIDNEHLKVGIVQIASRMVRKITPYVHEAYKSS